MKKASKRRTWTSVQVRELKSLAKKKTPAGKIAKTLKRSEGATRQKAFSLGVSLELALASKFSFSRCVAQIVVRRETTPLS